MTSDYRCVSCIMLEQLFYKEMVSHNNIVHWGINAQPLKYQAPLFHQALSQICKLSKPSFLGNPSLYIGFFVAPPPPPPPNRIFQWTLVILKFFNFNNPSHLLKVTRFLVKILSLDSQLWQRKRFLFIHFFCH